MLRLPRGILVHAPPAFVSCNPWLPKILPALISHPGSKQSLALRVELGMLRSL